MAQILLNIEIGIRFLRRELDDTLSKLLDEIEEPIHKICCKIRGEKMHSGTTVLLSRWPILNTSNLQVYTGCC